MATKKAKKIRRMSAADVKGTVDIAILTILKEEFDAVRDRFPTEAIAKGERDYVLSSADGYRVAMVRCVSQGNPESHQVTRDLIADLDPTWILVVGIAGGVPDDEFTLGDVVVSTHVHEFNVGALKPSGAEFSISGGPIAEEISRFAVNIDAHPEVQGWNTRREISTKRPTIDPNKGSLVGSAAWKKKVRDSLQYHFRDQPRDAPIAVTAQIASSDKLITDPEPLIQWLSSARHIRAIEMEMAGAYKAARLRGKTYPVVAIRGISDIVGLKRAASWKAYACHTAASFARAILRAEPIPPKNRTQSRKKKPKSRTADARVPPLPEIKELASPLEEERAVKRAFDRVKAYFKKGIAAAKKRKGFDAEFDEIDARTFEASMVAGKHSSRCRIWVGTALGSGTAISYGEGMHGFASSNSTNEIIRTKSIESRNVRFEATFRAFAMKTADFDPSDMTADEVAAYLWNQFVSRLGRA